ncbi:nuclear transport factor 2 family protein [Chryseolinea lacunae]|uniref:Nuclear transport factor 2 family protein n=1 Tax=Chryseolinea lacunae TaxID=2801331 RepID=A0ABS1KV35_9BACT|nr:nuclear transport factor 2 family protein [Chryseolinea lacunae]MBL0743326.1 nuclear transport factor 2 family protein [Chryseolinea lacunae]
MENKIIGVIEAYVAALTHRDVVGMSTLLHAQFSVITNASTAGRTSFLSKGDYLALIETNKAGGDTYVIADVSVQVMGPTAVASYTLQGKQTVMHVFLQLVQEGETWSVVSNMPFVTACAHA